MNPARRNICVVAVAVAMATLACSPLGGGVAPQKTQIPSAPAVTGAPTSAPQATTGSAATATVAAGEATATEGGASAATSEATQAPTSTYDTVAAQLTVPPLLTADAATAVAASGSLRQWAAAAKASSQYGDPDWAASQATNAPDSPLNCGDQKTAWASDQNTGVETLDLTYTTTVVPVAVNIYETNATGSIVKVDVEKANGTAHTVYAGLPLPTTDCPRTVSIGISGMTAHVNRVVITIDQSLIQNWDEIDAVELVGNP
jgi:hypothetical protein